MNLSIPKDWRFYGKYIGLGLIFVSGLSASWNAEFNSKIFWIGVIASGLSVITFLYFCNKEGG